MELSFDVYFVSIRVLACLLEYLNTRARRISIYLVKTNGINTIDSEREVPSDNTPLDIDYFWFTMKLALSFLASALALASASAIPASADATPLCKEGKVLEESSFTHDGVEIKVTTTACGDLSTLPIIEESSLSKRQATMCETFCGFILLDRVFLALNSLSGLRRHTKLLRGRRYERPDRWLYRCVQRISCEYAISAIYTPSNHLLSLPEGSATFRAIKGTTTRFTSGKCTFVYANTNIDYAYVNQCYSSVVSSWFILRHGYWCFLPQATVGLTSTTNCKTSTTITAGGSCIAQTGTATYPWFVA
jgi:hypothetical protein